MKIAVCDDEKEIREVLGEKITRLYPHATLIFFASGEELLVAEEVPDILLLDIQMDGKNGMEVARELRKNHKDMILIFVTALEEYVFQAFDVGAFHYLVKPLGDAKFQAVLQKAVEQCRDSREKKLETVEKSYILVHTQGTHRKIFLDTIVYAEVFNRKVLIHTTDGEIEYYGKLSELERMAGEDFFRPHRAYLIHFPYVVKYDASTIYLEKGQVLMAKKNYPEFVKRYLKYNQRKGRGLS